MGEVDRWFGRITILQSSLLELSQFQKSVPAVVRRQPMKDEHYARPSSKNIEAANSTNKIVFVVQGQLSLAPPITASQSY